MRAVIPVVFGVFVAIQASSLWSQDAIVSRKTSPWSIAKPENLKSERYEVAAVLSLQSNRAELDERIEVALAFVNRAKVTGDMYFKTREKLHEPLSVVLALCDQKGTFISSVLDPRGGSSIGANESDWVRLAPGGVFKHFDQWTAGRVRGDAFASYPRGLPAGNYLFQAIFLDRFASNCPFVSEATGESLGEKKTIFEPARMRLFEQWDARFSGKPLFRSNVVEFELVRASTK